MANFSRSQLKYAYYTWNKSEGECTTVEGFPENLPLNRIEGYEVLSFINRYMATHNYSLTSTFEMIEEAIVTRVPLDRRSHKNIKEWLEASYTF
ncbi:hypothetical protein [uncultured Flavobacterium sp.]|uniref:hypothetical protein n=1 Tax=uncultured Flavobacterium sp. TaxID=165435 RepID=UPI0025CFC5B4|nr:hypothetical protein [uncultured Flavobacterium sp.]